MALDQEPRTTETDGQRDFDFLMGRWKVHNRRLRERLRGCDDWDEFEATVVARPIWDGAANIDEYDGEGPSGRIQGLTLRLYDAESRQWRLYWANRERGFLELPMVGTFKDGRGEFFCHEIYQGTPIFTRFVWSDITPEACRWEQAFSTDGGRTWETNWVNHFTRIE
jgi:hypothetical protein